MKKLFFVFAILSLVVFGCTKHDLNPTTKYVGTVNGSYIPQDVNVSLAKDLDLNNPLTPVPYTRNWIMYAKNSPFYPNETFALVTGLEFIQGSAAQIWWSTNNPVSFAASQAVYSNLTPVEPVRLIMETKRADNVVAYLGILDFDPTCASFPLTVNGFRLGDVLEINTGNLTTIPGGSALTFSVAYDEKIIDLDATEKGYISGGNGAGVTGEFGFADIKYKSQLEYHNAIRLEDINNVVYNSLLGKVTGSIVITINEPATSSTPAHAFQVSIPDSGPSASVAGQGRLFTLHTDKVGWYDSSTIGVTDKDITINSVVFDIN